MTTPRSFPALLACGAVATAVLGSTGGSEEPPAAWRVVEAAIARGAVEEPARAALEHLAGVPRRRHVPGRFARVDAALVEPWAAPGLAAELRAWLEAPVQGRGSPRFSGLAPSLAEWMDHGELERASPAAEDPVLRELGERWERIADEDVEGLALLEELSAFVGRAHTGLAATLEELGPGGRELLFTTHPAFCEAWYRQHFPASRAEEQAGPEQVALTERWIEEVLTGGGRDVARALGIADALLRLTDRGFVADLGGRLARVDVEEAALEGIDGDVRAAVGEAAHERVVLCGRRDNRHAAAAALVIDLGGTDTWERAAVADSEDLLVSIVLDLRGNDRYESRGPGPCYATGGVALLVDAAGNDTYTSERLGQGASALGFALLVDLEGDDVYGMADYGQGHGLAGVGLLYDLEGNDEYVAWAFAQGGGIGPGVSALVDGEGDDRYRADLFWPDVYGNSGPESHHGASQGYCTGLRPAVPGGFAALLDLGQGEDDYQSGNFSQGGGYYFSFGLMFDGGGDDENRGYRYSQGFGVHQAVGVRWDAGGDDVYRCRSVAHCGMAWDEGVGWFLEEGGDDEYQTGGLALGGAAQTGVAVCIDAEGDDVYESGGSAQGGTGGSEYHDKPSIGVLIDLGGGRDVYSQPDRGDAALHIDDGVGICFDTKARTMEKALADRELRR